jgi:hypothetical protein
MLHHQSRLLLQRRSDSFLPQDSPCLVNFSKVLHNTQHRIWREIIVIKRTSKSMERGTKKWMRRVKSKRMAKKTIMIKILVGRSSFVQWVMGKIIIHPHGKTTII